MLIALKTKKLISLAICLSTLAACSPRVLDARNATISNGLIYAGNSNEPFTGKVTNVQLHKLPLSGVHPIVQTLVNVTGDARYAGWFATGFVSGDSPVCDVQANKGILDGDLLCSYQRGSLLKLSFDEGTIDGDVQVLDPRSEGAVVAKAGMKSGRLNGQSTIYDAAGGKVLHSVGWVEGVLNGVEEQRDRTGNLIFKATLVNGKYQGEAVRYDSQGKLMLTTIYSAGVAQKNIRPDMSEVENCVEDWAIAHRSKFGGIGIAPELRQTWREACLQGRTWNSPRQEGREATTNSDAKEECVQSWTTAFRKQAGDDALIKQDQLEEWSDWCRQGKKPA